MSTQTETPGSPPQPTSHRVFTAVDTVALAFDESRSCAQEVIRLSGTASEKLWEMEMEIRGTTKQATSRMVTGIVNTLLSTVGLPSPETLADQIDQLFTATSAFERSCIVILTLGDDLRSLKAKEDLHMLLETLLNAWDFLFQMQCDTYVLKNAELTYNVLDKMISEIGKVKDVSGKAGGELAGLASTSKRNFKRLIHLKQTDSKATDADLRTSEEQISSTAPRLREMLFSIKKQWPGLLKAIEELKPHLEQMAEKVDIALEVK
jgi:hypothetical protein